MPSPSLTLSWSALKRVTTFALAALGVALSSPAVAFAQTGRIVGRIIDAGTSQGLSDAQVAVVGTQIVVLSGVDGRYALNSVPTGTVTIQVRRLGYAQKTVTGLMLTEGQSLEQSVTLGAATVQLATTVVSASTERGSVNEALNGQKTAVGVINAVTAEQIAKSPDANAAQAIQRVSGVTVQDNKFIFVRGLGERYTTSSLNGARVPSPEPEKRVVPLDMFPAGLLQSVTTIKTFTPDQQGDFAGALVDIKTREFPARRTWSLNLGSGYESGTTGTSLISPAVTGGEGFAMTNGDRDLPTLVRSVGNFSGLNLTTSDKKLLISQFRNAWSPSAKNATPAVSGSVSLGGNQSLFKGHRLGYLLSGTISSSTDVKEGLVRALADRGTTLGQTIETDRFEGSSTQQSVLWGGLMNLSTLVGGSSRISFNGMYNRTADNTARVEMGTFSSDATFAKITRMQYVERSVNSWQLSGDHHFGGRHQVEWFTTLSNVSRYEPDKSEFVQVLEKDTPSSPGVYRWFSGGSGGAVRTFADLDEQNKEGSARYSFSFGTPGQQSTVKVGALYRNTARVTDNRAFNITALGVSNSIRELAPEVLFSAQTLESSTAFDLGPLSQGGAYNAHDTLTAGFIMADIPLGSRVRLIGGARYESDHLQVNAASTLGTPVTTNKIWNDLLPSLAMSVRFSETQQLRLSGSRTLARPEYRELSPIISRDVVGGDDVQGNDQLKRTNVTNFDVRWEAYPSSSEIVSVALFAKQFENPIERTYVASSGSRQILYVNADRSNNYGIELEVRKDLGTLGRMFRPWSVFSNVTVMHSKVTLSPDQGTSQTNLKRRMVGQAPFVINGGITYSSRTGGTTATLLYNRVGERIDAAGESPLPDVVEAPRNVLDLSMRWNVVRAITLRVDARNLMNAAHETVQGTVVRERYLTGRTFQAGIQIRP